jgi:hypothetical protein
VAITAQLRDWFGRSEPPLRTALGLALGFHGLADQAVERIIADEVGQSISWAILSDDLVAIAWSSGPGFASSASGDRTVARTGSEWPG